MGRGYTLLYKLLSVVESFLAMQDFINAIRSVFVGFSKAGKSTAIAEGPIPERAPRGGEYMTTVGSLYGGDEFNAFRDFLNDPRANNYTSLSGRRPELDLSIPLAGFDSNSVFCTSRSLWSVLRAMQVVDDFLFVRLSYELMDKSTPLHEQIKDFVGLLRVKTSFDSGDVRNRTKVRIIDVDEDNLEAPISLNGGKLLLYGQDKSKFDGSNERIEVLIKKYKATVFLDLGEFSPGLTAGVCAFSDEAFRNAFVNVNEHCRASLATTTQFLVQAYMTGVIDRVESVDDSKVSIAEGECKLSWIGYCIDRFGIDVSSDCITHNHGASAALTVAFEQLYLYDKVEQVIFPTPYFSPDNGMARVGHLKPVEGVLDFSGDKSWANAMIEMIDRNGEAAEDSNDAFSKTALVITIPNNPDGRVPKLEDVERVLAHAKDKNIKILGDFTYYDVIHSDVVRDNFDQIIRLFYETEILSIFSHTKSRSLCGDRIATVMCKDTRSISRHVQLRDLMFDPVSLMSLLALEDSYNDETVEHRLQAQKAFSKQLNDNLAKFIAMLEGQGVDNIIHLPEAIEAGLYAYVFVNGVTGQAVHEEGSKMGQLFMDEGRFGKQAHKEGAYFRLSFSGNWEDKCAAFQAFIDAVKTVRAAGTK